MKLTPSTTFTALARGANKTLSWKIYARLTDNLNDSLSLTNWTDVSWRAQIEFPIKQSIEFELGQFSTDGVGIVGFGIQWWKTAFFENASPKKYTEFKIEMTLGGAADVMPMFYGFVNNTKDSVDSNNRENVCRFVVRAASDIGDTLSAEFVSCQPINGDVNGAGLDGLILFDIWGMYVTNANVTSFVLKRGIHTISYQYNSGSPAFDLDGGTSVSITTDGLYTAENGTTERVQVYIDVSDLPNFDCEEKIIVATEGDTIPRKWFNKYPIREILKYLYAGLGIGTTYFDSDALSFDTYDGRREVSFLDVPPFPTSYDPWIPWSGTIAGDGRALATDGTDLFVAVGSAVYRRTQGTATTGPSYTYLFGAGHEQILRMFYNLRNNHLWAFNDHGRLFHYEFATSLMRYVDLNVTVPNVVASSMELMDYNYTGSSWYYHLVYTDVNNGTSQGLLRDAFFTGSALILSTIVTGATLGYTTVNGIKSIFAYKKDGNKFRFRVTNNSAVKYYHQYSLSAAGAWVNDGVLAFATPDDYTVAAYHPTEDRIYYYKSTTYEVMSHTNSSNLGGNLVPYLNGDKVENITYLASTGLVYFSAHHYNSGIGIFIDDFYSVAANVVTPILSGAYVAYHQIVNIGTTLYLLGQMDSYFPALYQIDTSVVPSIDMFDATDKTVTQLLNEILISFFLVGKISANKTASIYKRCLADGTPTTSGNNLSVAVSDINAEGLDEETFSIPKVDFVEISNGTDEQTYDGADFGVGAGASDVRASYSNPLISAALFKELLYYKYQFLKDGRKKVPLALGCVPLFQFEPLDGLTIDTTTANISASETAPIYSCAYSEDGSLEVEILI